MWRGRYATRSQAATVFINIHNSIETNLAETPGLCHSTLRLTEGPHASSHQRVLWWLWPVGGILVA